MKTTGIIILIIGIVLTIFTTFQFITKEKVVDLGPLEITKEKPHSMSWSPILGIVLMGVGGGILLLKASKK